MVEIDFTEENILFGLCSQRVPDKIHIILEAKLSISKYKYGKHANLIYLFKKKENSTLYMTTYKEMFIFMQKL